MSGVRITRAPTDLKTLSALGENFLSRSWITPFSLIPSSSSVQAKEVLASLGIHASSRLAVHAASKTRLLARCIQVHIDKDVEALEEDGVDAEEVGHHQGLGLSRQELLPAQLGSAT